MQINLTKRIVVLTWLICSYSMVNAQSWSKSFTAGGYDSNNTLLGGSEVLQLVDHKSMLFASIGYWQDENNIWYGGSNNNIGWGQINRLDNYILTRYCWKNLNIPENLKRELEDSYNNCLKHKNSIVTRQPVNDVSTEIFIVKDSPTYRRLKKDKILNQAELEKYFLRFQLWSKIRYRYPLHILNDLIPQLIQDIRARRNTQ